MAGKVRITYGKRPGDDAYSRKKWIAQAGGCTGTGESVEIALYDLVEKLVDVDG